MLVRSVVYIETTIPSFYYEVRQDHNSLAFRDWTREWWDDHRSKYQLRTSQAVLDEAAAGDYPTKADVLGLLNEVPLLPFAEEIRGITDYYIQHHIMPDDPRGDALHLATASFHKCDFLLTWN